MTRSDLDLLAVRLFDELRDVSREDGLRRIRLAFLAAMRIEVLTLDDIAAALQQGPRYMEKLVTLQNKSRVACLPPEIPGIKHRYRKEDVARWLKSGIPASARNQAA